MIGTSTAELYLIHFWIIFLQYLAPLCLLCYLVAVGICGSQAAFHPVLLVIALIALFESLFFLVVYRPFRARLQQEAVHPPTLPRAEREALFDLCVQSIPDAEAYLKVWFLGAPSWQIRRENVKEFFLWSFFNRGGPPGDDDDELETYVEGMEKILGRSIEPGRGNARPLRLTLDKVIMLHRSIAWYFCVGFVDFLTFMNLCFRKGFEFHRTSLASLFTVFPFRPHGLLTTKRSPVSNLTYWHRRHTSPTKLPVLFIHGIGIGLYPYASFLGELNSMDGLDGEVSDGQIGVIAIEIMSISSRITAPALSKDEMCEAIATILAHLGWDKVVLAAHSYGTIISAHLLKSPVMAPMIGPVVFMDPVSILLHLPNVAYNFTRRRPKRANERQLHYFASTDMCISHTLARQFFWSESVLWKKDFKDRNMTFSLSGRDLIVDSEAVGRYLASDHDASLVSSSAPLANDGSARRKGHGGVAEHAREVGDAEELVDWWKERIWTGQGIDILWFADCDHAQVFDKRATRRPLVRATRAYCAQTGGDDGRSVDP